MLLLAIEALASSLRYDHKDASQKTSREDFQKQVDAALSLREENGLSAVELPLKRDLPGVGWLNVRAFSLIEWLPNQTDPNASFPPPCVSGKDNSDEPF